MKRTLFTLVCCMILSTFIPIRATILYVYQEGNYTPLLMTVNIYRITFENDTMNLQTEAKRQAQIAMKDFNYFRFYRTSVPTAIKDTKAESHDIRIQNDKNCLYISASQPVEEVLLTSIEGKTLSQLHPNDCEVALSIRQLPKGIYVVKAQSKGCRVSKKIEKK